MPEGEQPEGAFRSDRLQVVRADHQPVRPRGRAQRPAQCDRQEGEARREEDGCTRSMRIVSFMAYT